MTNNNQCTCECNKSRSGLAESLASKGNINLSRLNGLIAAEVFAGKESVKLGTVGGRGGNITITPPSENMFFNDSGPRF